MGRTLRDRWNDVRRGGDAWLLRRLPEYELFPSEEQRERTIAELDQELEKSDDYWWSVVVVSIAALLPWWGAWWLAERTTWLPGAVRFLIIGLAPVTLVAANIWYWRRCVARRLRRALRALGVPVCLRCGYSMLGLPAPRCPECGWQAENDNSV